MCSTACPLDTTQLRHIMFSTACRIDTAHVVRCALTVPCRPPLIFDKTQHARQKKKTPRALLRHAVFWHSTHVFNSLLPTFYFVAITSSNFFYLVDILLNIQFITNITPNRFHLITLLKSDKINIFWNI